MPGVQQELQLGYNPEYTPADPSVTKVKLRLHFRGQFVQVRGHALSGCLGSWGWCTEGPSRLQVADLQQWRYVGGEVFNESIPVTFKYADLCRKLNDKFGDTVSFKYQSPGDEADPETLVAVTDDGDLQVKICRHILSLQYAMLFHIF